MASAMSAKSLGEFQAIFVLKQVLERGAASAQIVVGIGDDAAVLKAKKQPLVWSIDTSAEGVHFDLSWLSLRQAAARAFVAALSDLAAMGARPVAALCALQVPTAVTRAQLRAVADGQSQVATRYSCPVVGGNLCRGSHWIFNTTVLGMAPKPRLRSGARVGDEVWLSGTAGEAAAGLCCLQRGEASHGQSSLAKAIRQCVRAWRQPQALIDTGAALATTAHALLDVSDGVASEARHLAEASRVKVLLDESSLQRCISPALRVVAKHLALDPLQLLLYGGEDYALLGAGNGKSRPPAAACIGRVQAGRGVALVGAKGQRPLAAGFDHLLTDRQRVGPRL
jgi:thiamine-monophosphate kinase